MTIRITLFVVVFFLLLAFKNQTIHVIHADKNRGEKIGDEQIRILEGSVHVVKDTVNIFCDWARFFELQNKLVLSGRVYLIDGKRKMKSHQAVYYPDDNKIECIGHVRLYSPDDSLFAHNVIYNTKSEDAWANDSVYVWGKKDNAVITGRKGFLQKSKSYVRIQQNAFFMHKDTTSQDTFKVWSEYMEYYGDTLKYAFASDSVRIYQGTFHAKADSAWYYSKSQIAWLKGKPHVWLDESELTGEKIKTTFDSTKVRNIFVSGNAVAISLSDSIKKEHNVLKGKSIEVFVNKNKPQEIISRNNAISIYYLKDKEAEQGVNYSTSDSIFVFFMTGKLDSIEVIGGAQGIYYPEDYKGVKKFGE